MYYTLHNFLAPVNTLYGHTGYDTKQSDKEAQVLEFYGMWSTPLLPLHPSPH